MNVRIPLPRPTALSRPHWDGARAGELRFQRCRDCGEAVFIPQPVCPGCFGDGLDWAVSSGRATVYSFSVVHRPPSPGFEVPYIVVIAELEEGWLAGGEGVSLLLDALDNFNYSRLRVDLNGLPDGQTEMRFRIRGKNPDLYGGAEVELNMSVTGRLEQILRQSYEAYFEVPEEIARKLATQTPSVEGTATPIEGR